MLADETRANTKLRIHWLRHLETNINISIPSLYEIHHHHRKTCC